MSQTIVEKKELEGTVTSDDILGKDVIDHDGDFIGIVEKIHIDPNTIEFMGISIDKGFLRRGLAIGKDYIDKITPHAVMLKIRPAHKIKGMQVFDLEGNKVGIVVKVDLVGRKNKVRGIIVKASMIKTYQISSNLIESVGHNVFLKIAKNELK